MSKKIFYPFTKNITTQWTTWIYANLTQTSLPNTKEVVLIFFVYIIKPISDFICKIWLPVSENYRNQSIYVRIIKCIIKNKALINQLLLKQDSWENEPWWCPLITTASSTLRAWSELCNTYTCESAVGC